MGATLNLCKAGVAPSYAPSHSRPGPLVSVELKEPERLTGVGFRRVAAESTAALFVLQFQNICQQTADISKGSPWVWKSTLLNSTKPEL